MLRNQLLRFFNTFYFAMFKIFRIFALLNKTKKDMKTITNKNEIKEFLTNKDNVIQLEIFSSQSHRLKNNDTYIDLTFKATIISQENFANVGEIQDSIWGNSKFYAYFYGWSDNFFNTKTIDEQKCLVYELIENILYKHGENNRDSIDNLFDSGILDEFTIDINNINKIDINETKPFIELKNTSSRLKLYNVVERLIAANKRVRGE